MEFEDGESLIALPCKHSYHPECINQWLQINKVNIISRSIQTTAILHPCRPLSFHAVINVYEAILLRILVLGQRALFDCQAAYVAKFCVKVWQPKIVSKFIRHISGKSFL